MVGIYVEYLLNTVQCRTNRIETGTAPRSALGSGLAPTLKPELKLGSEQEQRCETTVNGES